MPEWSAAGPDPGTAPRDRSDPRRGALITLLALPPPPLQCSPSPFLAGPPSVVAPQSHGIAAETCNEAGTSCTYVCAPGYSSANPSTNNTLFCSPSGLWVGNLPVCVPAAPNPPAQVASVMVGGQMPLTVQWLPPTSDGTNWPTDRYKISSAPSDWSETFASGGFPDPSKWRPAPLDAQMANAYTFDPVTGELVMDGAQSGSCAFNNAYNCYTMIRDWPVESGIPVTGSWAIEASMRMDDFSSRQAQNSENIGIGIYDMGVWRGPAGGSQRLGALQFYAGVRKDSNVFQYGWETLYSTWNNWYNAQGAQVYVRIERDAVAGTWTSFFRFHSGDDWIRNPRTGYDALLINGSLTAPLLSNVKVRQRAGWRAGGRALPRHPVSLPPGLSR